MMELRLKSQKFFVRHAPSIFVGVTMLTSVGVLLWPLPVMVGPVVVSFIPMGVAILLVRGTEEAGQLRAQLFGAQYWRMGGKWWAISLGLAVGLRLGVSGVALILGYPFQPGAFSLLLLATFVFAAGEEIGWRGYLLPRLLARGVSPLRASFWIGIPWAIIHLPLTLQGKLAAGVPPGAQFLMLLSLSVMTTWVYLGAKRNILAPTLLHGGQNALVVLNDHLPLVATNWWMAGVFGGVALALVVGTQGRLTSAETNFRTQTSGSAPPVSPGRALDRPDQSRR